MKYNLGDKTITITGDDYFIADSAVVVGSVRIGTNCLIGAGALVLEGTVIPDNSLAIGAPAKVIRQVTPIEIDVIHDGAVHYIKNFQNYKKYLHTSF